MRQHKTKASLQAEMFRWPGPTYSLIRTTRRCTADLIETDSEAIDHHPIQKPCSQSDFAKTLFLMLRKLAWVLTFILATFCWVVIIEHGPDNFIAGSKIEAENFKSLFFRLIQLPGK
jgi:hypothetical protein